MADDRTKVSVGQAAAGKDREIEVGITLVVQIGLAVEVVDIPVIHLPHRNTVGFVRDAEGHRLADIPVAVEEKEIEQGIPMALSMIGSPNKSSSRSTGYPSRASALTTSSAARRSRADVAAERLCVHMCVLPFIDALVRIVGAVVLAALIAGL